MLILKLKLGVFGGQVAAGGPLTLGSAIALGSELVWVRKHLHECQDSRCPSVSLEMINDQCYSLHLSAVYMFCFTGVSACINVWDCTGTLEKIGLKTNTECWKGSACTIRGRREHREKTKNILKRGVRLNSRWVCMGGLDSKIMQVISHRLVII